MGVMSSQREQDNKAPSVFLAVQEFHVSLEVLRHRSEILYDWFLITQQCDLPYDII
jgi:hypothetical protein